MGHHRIGSCALTLVLLSSAIQAVSAGITPSPYWKNSIVFPDDPFTHEDPGLPRWVKFTILVSDPTTVYFQDSVTYPFHYDFAVDHLDPFRGMSPSAFDAVTLHAAGQQAILGAVLFSPDAGLPEFGIQLVRLDPYTPQEVVDLFHIVRSAVVADPSVQAFYFPTYQQLATAVEHEAFLADQGVLVSSVDRWAESDACYSFGWALGRLKHVPGDQIEAAFLDGTLRPEDVLLTDGAPSDMPLVAGVIALAPATPNSHVVILANTFGVPFVHLVLDENVARAEQLVGRRMVLRAEEQFGRCEVRLIDVEGVLDQATIDEILLLKEPLPLNISPVETYGAYSANTQGLHPPDIRFFGGKAANYGLIRRSIPAVSPVAGAFSFDLWSAFMQQPVVSGGTLGQSIAVNLAGFDWPPGDMNALETALASVRDRIEDDTVFNAQLQVAVLGMLESPQYGFDPMSNIRFRSSTNLEDADQFTGAGLYDSFSGCLADDLDADGTGPSLCDPTEPKERGVFRAIRKVFASFYNLDAYLERLRHGVDEDQVGMALLVHHSFPDAFELANGVATLKRQNSSSLRKLRFVTQAGAVSVTNPEPGAIPEIVEGAIFGSFSDFTLVQESNLVQLGTTVLDFSGEYEDLAALLLAVAAAYEQETGLGDYTLEFEYKKLAPGGAAIPAGGLEVDQVRRIPEPDETPSITPFLINQPVELCVFQGEYGDVFANHRLKSRWLVSTESLWLTAPNLATNFLAQTTIDYTESCIALEQSGVPEQWPDATYGFGGGTATVGFSLHDLQNPRDYTLTIDGIPTLVAPAESPLLVFEDFGCLGLEVDYATPVPAWDWSGPTTTTTDFVRLCTCPVPRPSDLPQSRLFSGPSGLAGETSFFWPEEPLGIVAGYTAPLVRFEQTAITGLTSAPLVLTAERAQTYRPEHHNFVEHFLFDPVLDPGVSAAQLAELDAAGVRAIHFRAGFGGPNVAFYDDAAWGSICLACLGDDNDGDGSCVFAPTFDCDDGNPAVWATPGEVPNLRFSSPDTLGWGVPVEPGAVSVVYDTLRSSSPADFTDAGTSCIESDDGADIAAVDTSIPAPATGFYYHVRAENACPLGQGPLGTASSGAPRQGIDCPQQEQPWHRAATAAR